MLGYGWELQTKMAVHFQSHCLYVVPYWNQMVPVYWLVRV